jgi:hypothetical protein
MTVETKLVLDTSLCGVLADSPVFFAGCNMVRRMYETDLHDLSISNTGIKTNMRGLWNGGYLLPLDCYSTPTGESLGIHLRKVGREMYLRVNPFSLQQYTAETVEERPAVERYLLTSVPLLPGTTEYPQYLPARKLLPAVRVHSLQITLPEEI